MNKVGKISTEETIQKLGDTLTTDPKSIKEICEETGVGRQAAAKYLKALAGSGLIKQDKIGRKRVFWKPTLSDRQTGLELRGTSYELQKAAEHLEKARQKNEDLIEKSSDGYKLKNKDSKTTEGENQ